MIFSALIPSVTIANPLSPKPRETNSEPKLAMLLSPVNQAIIPPSLGTVLAISARALAALDANIILAGFIPPIASPNPLSPKPRETNSEPKLAMLLSPVNQALTPPSLGTVLAISARALAALVAAIIFSAEIPSVTIAKSFKPIPKEINSEPKLAMLLSPANQPTTPSSLGMILAISARALAALAAFITFFESMPAVFSAKLCKPVPKEINCTLKLEILSSPVNQAASPFGFGIILAISARALAALAAFITFFESMPAVFSANPSRPIPNDINWLLKLAMLLSPANQLTTPPSLGIILAISARALAALAEFTIEALSIPETQSA